MPRGIGGYSPINVPTASPSIFLFQLPAGNWKLGPQAKLLILGLGWYDKHRALLELDLELELELYRDAQNLPRSQEVQISDRPRLAPRRLWVIRAGPHLTVILGRTVVPRGIGGYEVYRNLLISPKIPWGSTTVAINFFLFL